MSRRSTVYVISVAAELCGMHPQTLRIYERKGLVQPTRTSGGSRRYSDADIALLQRISKLTSEGMNLVGVKRVLDLEQRVAALEAEIAQHRSASSTEPPRRQGDETPLGHGLVPIRQTVAIYKPS